LRIDAGVVVVLALVVVLSASFGALNLARSGGTPDGSPTASLASNDPVEISLAEASLSRGQGPAFGTNFTCQAVGDSSARCGAATPAPSAVSTGGYSWINLTSRESTAPGDRITQMAWDPSDGYVLLFGGYALTGLDTDTWTFANGTWTNITASTTGAPPPIAEAGMAYDPASHKVVLFGGYDLQTVSVVGYTWTYHAKTWTNLTSSLHSAPSARDLIAMTTDTTDGQVLLFGGENGSMFHSDTWTYKNGTWTNITSAQPTRLPALDFATVGDYPGHGAFLVGAFTDLGKWATGTYTFSAGAWTNITSSLTVAPPTPLALGYVAYLPSLAGVLEFSSDVVLPSGAGAFCACAWLYSASGWQNVSTLIGSNLDELSTIAGSAAYNPTDQSIVAFGGERLNAPPIFNGYTWVLSAPPTVTAHVSKSVVDAGQPVTFSGTLSGGFEPNKVAWTFGDGSNSSNLSQSHTYAAAGFFTATLKGTSLTGANSSASVSLQVNAAPAVAISSTTNATAGAPVGLAATITGGTGPYTYAWTLGDSGTSAAAFVSHTYANAGTYAVNVTITDAVGATAHATVSLVVGSAPSSSSSSSLSLSSGTGLYLLIGILVLLVVAVLLGVLLMRKPKSPAGAPTPYAGPMTAPPPPPVPPPGAGGPPPPGAS
jgi:hypothetical protein